MCTLRQQYVFFVEFSLFFCSCVFFSSSASSQLRDDKKVTYARHCLFYWLAPCLLMVPLRICLPYPFDQPTWLKTRHYRNISVVLFNFACIMKIFNDKKNDLVSRQWTLRLPLVVVISSSSSPMMIDWHSLPHVDSSTPRALSLGVAVAVETGWSATSDSSQPSSSSTRPAGLKRLRDGVSCCNLALFAADLQVPRVSSVPVGWYAHLTPVIETSSDDVTETREAFGSDEVRRMSRGCRHRHLSVRWVSASININGSRWWLTSETVEMLRLLNLWRTNDFSVSRFNLKMCSFVHLKCGCVAPPHLFSNKRFNNGWF